MALGYPECVIVSDDRPELLLDRRDRLLLVSAVNTLECRLVCRIDGVEIDEQE